MKDLFSNRIVGYSISVRFTRHLDIGVLRAVLARRRLVVTVIVHSDRGSQFRSRDFVAVLRTVGLSGSMGRVAAAGDNAAMESFDALLQKNVLDRQRWTTRAQLVTTLFAGLSTPKFGAADNADSANPPPPSSNSLSPTMQSDHTQQPSTEPAEAPGAAKSKGYMVGP